MNKQPDFTWNNESGTSSCILSDGVNEFIGIAMCCDDDKDMISEKTGCTIALFRAEIAYYKHMRDNEIKPALNALNHLKSIITSNSKFNPKSYEYRRLISQINQKEDDLTVIKKLLKDKREELKEYIDSKEKCYQRIRYHRHEGQKTITE